MYGLVGKMRAVAGQRDALIAILLDGVSGMLGVQAETPPLGQTMRAKRIHSPVRRAPSSNGWAGFQPSRALARSFDTHDR